MVERPVRCLRRSPKVSALLAYIRREPWTETERLATIFDVSPATMRQWLWLFDSAGMVHRRHDQKTGAVLVAMADVSVRTLRAAG